MSVIERIKKMGMEEFYHLCNRLAKEMGFHVRNGVYREDTVVIDAHMPVPGNEIRYILVFIRKNVLTEQDVREIVDFDTLQIRWMLITTGKIDDSAKKLIPTNMEVTLMDGSELERLVTEFGIIKEQERRGSYLPSVGQLDNLIEWGEEFYQNGNYEKALEYVEQAQRIKNTPRVMKLKAKILTAMGRYEEALAILKRILVENVRDDEAWFLIGLALQDMGVMDDAEEAYGQCVRFNPRNVGCWLNRGNILFSMEKYDEALLCYENALKVRQNIPNAWNNRGVVLKYKGKYDEAMRSYNAAIKYDPNFAQAYLNKAILFYEMRRYEEAENAIYQYLKIEESEQAYLLLADIYKKRAMQAKAEEMARKALQINPASEEAKSLLGEIEEPQDTMRAEFIKSIDSIMDMLSEDMTEVRSILMAAKQYAQQGELEKAKENLNEAKDAMRDYVNEKSRREAIIADIIELAEGNAIEVPNLETLSISELKEIRERIIAEAHEKKSVDGTKQKLLLSLEKIKEKIRNAGMLDAYVEESLSKVRDKIENEEYSEAMEMLLSISAGFERKKIEEMRKVLVEDTKDLLNEADMPVPETIESMEIGELRELRKKAMASLRGEEKKSDGGLKDMVSILSGAAMGAAVEETVEAAESVGQEKEDSVEVSIRAEILEDVRELASLAGEELPEEVDSWSIADLKNLRRELIEKIKSKKSAEETEYPGAVAHLLFEMDGDVPEVDDEFGNNVMGMLALRDKNYEEAVRRFRRAIAINPEFREAEFNLAYALHRMGKRDEERMHLRNLGLDEDFFDMH